MEKGGENVYVFIDAANIWGAYKAKGYFFDFEKLKDYLKKRYKADVINFFYYFAYPADGTRDYDLDGRHRFYTYLKKALGFTVRKKELKRIYITTKEGQHIKEKGDMDIEITLDALHHIDKYDTAVFFTGDSDFLALISYLRNRKKKVFVYSSENNISKELRTGADGYIDVLEIEEDIWGRELKHKKELEKKQKSQKK